MIKEFDRLKQQLAELAEVVNRFESEAVQLRVVEMVLDPTFERSRAFAENRAARYIPGPMLSEMAHTARSARSRTGAGSARGAVAALNELIRSDFFDRPRTIGDIVSHCEATFGTRYKSNAFSGPLSRHARSGTLAREKNEDGNFVYSNERPRA